jgi:hypothetical protein
MIITDGYRDTVRANPACQRCVGQPGGRDATTGVDTSTRRQRSWGQYGRFAIRGIQRKCHVSRSTGTNTALPGSIRSSDVRSVDLCGMLTVPVRPHINSRFVFHPPIPIYCRDKPDAKTAKSTTAVNVANRVRAALLGDQRSAAANAIPPARRRQGFRRRKRPDPMGGGSERHGQLDTCRRARAAGGVTSAM